MSHAQLLENGLDAASERTQWQRSVGSFLQWLNRHGYEGYDPYDIWGTRYGIWSRRLYYKFGTVAAPLIAPMLLMEVLCPGFRKWAIEKQRYPTADAQLGIGLLNLYQTTSEERLLREAENLGEALLESSIPG